MVSDNALNLIICLLTVQMTLLIPAIYPQASSGILPTAECQVAYQDLQMRHKLRYIIFAINNVEIIVDSTEIPAGGDPKKEYEDFTNLLEKKECCWAAYDFEYDLGDAGKRSKVLFISW